MSSAPDGPPRALPALKQKSGNAGSSRFPRGPLGPKRSTCARVGALFFSGAARGSAATVAPTLLERKKSALILISGGSVSGCATAARERVASGEASWDRVTVRWPHRAQLRRDCRRAVCIDEPGLLSDRGAARPRAARRSGAPGRRHRHRRKIGHFGRRQKAEPRAFRESWQRVGLGVFGHRHRPEIEQELGTPVTFVPHLVPIDRGILETIYGKVRPGTSANDVADVTGRRLSSMRRSRRLTGESLPEIKHAAYTNFCDIGWRVDSTNGRILLVAVIDNLVKGAAGQAIQNFNVMLGLDERTGLLPLKS